MTAPTEVEIRTFMETYDADNWKLDYDTIRDRAAEGSGAFEDFIESDRITDDDFGVFSDAHTAEIRAIMPALNAAVRPLLIEAQVRATLAFFARFPNAPRAVRERVSA